MFFLLARLKKHTPKEGFKPVLKSYCSAGTIHIQCLLLYFQHNFMDVFLLLKYKHALLPIWEPSYFVLFKIPVLIKHCIYNVNLKESLPAEVAAEVELHLQFSISPSRAVSCLKNAKLRAQPAACTMWPCGSCQEPLLCCHRGPQPEYFLSAFCSPWKSIWYCLLLKMQLLCLYSSQALFLFW